MVKENNMDDLMITNLVRSVKYAIPETVEAKLNAAMSKQKKRDVPHKARLWVPVSAVLVMLFFIAALFIFSPFLKTPTEELPPITEIKTELELPDANIKIIWVQKKDFKLN